MSTNSDEDHPDFFEGIVIQDLKRAFKTPEFRPKALVFCILIDFWLGTIIFGPLIFMVFRGSWQCWDFVLILVIGCGVTQSICTTLAGCLIMTGIVLANVYLQNLLKPDPSGRWCTCWQVSFFLASRTFVLVSICSETLMWKGMWELLDYMRLIYGWEKNVYLLITLVLMLMLTKSLNVCHCSPVGKGFYYDIEREYLTIKTAFQLKQDSKWYFHLADAFATVLLNVMTSAVYHSFWTSIEVVIQVLAVDGTVSNLDIVLLALLFSLIGFLIQFPNLYIHSKPVGKLFQLISHQFMLIITLVGDVLVFRTGWCLLDEWILTRTASDEISVLRLMKISGTTAFQDSVDEYEDVQFHIELNATISETCELLEDRLTMALDIDFVSYLVSFFLLVVLRVSSTVICGVKRETHRFENGIMIPRYYLTYLLSETGAVPVPVLKRTEDSTVSIL